MFQFYFICILLLLSIKSIYSIKYTNYKIVLENQTEYENLPWCTPNNLKTYLLSSYPFYFLLQNDGTFSIQFKHCRLKIFNYNQAYNCLKGHHITYSGDSLTRYYSINLMLFFAKREWVNRLFNPSKKPKFYSNRNNKKFPLQTQCNYAYLNGDFPKYVGYVDNQLNKNDKISYSRALIDYNFNRDNKLLNVYYHNIKKEYLDDDDNDDNYNRYLKNKGQNDATLKSNIEKQIKNDVRISYIAWFGSNFMITQYELLFNPYLKRYFLAYKDYLNLSLCSKGKISPLDVAKCSNRKFYNYAKYSYESEICFDDNKFSRRLNDNINDTLIVNNNIKLDINKEEEDIEEDRRKLYEDYISLKNYLNVVNNTTTINNNMKSILNEYKRKLLSNENNDDLIKYSYSEKNIFGAIGTTNLLINFGQHYLSNIQKTCKSMLQKLIYNRNYFVPPRGTNRIHLPVVNFRETFSPNLYVYYEKKLFDYYLPTNSTSEYSFNRYFDRNHYKTFEYSPPKTKSRNLEEISTKTGNLRIISTLNITSNTNIPDNNIANTNILDTNFSNTNVSNSYISRTSLYHPNLTPYIKRNNLIPLNESFHFFYHDNTNNFYSSLNLNSTMSKKDKYYHTIEEDYIKIGKIAFHNITEDLLTLYGTLNEINILKTKRKQAKNRLLRVNTNSNNNTDKEELKFDINNTNNNLNDDKYNRKLDSEEQILYIKTFDINLLSKKDRKEIKMIQKMENNQTEIEIDDEDFDENEEDDEDEIYYFSNFYNVPTDLSHYQSWIYNEINNLLLNSICPHDDKEVYSYQWTELLENPIYNKDTIIKK